MAETEELIGGNTPYVPAVTEDMVGSVVPRNINSVRAGRRRPSKDSCDEKNETLISLRIPVQLKTLVSVVSGGVSGRPNITSQIHFAIKDSLQLENAISSWREHLAVHPPAFAILGWKPSREQCIDYIYDTVAKSVGEDALNATRTIISNTNERVEALTKEFYQRVEAGETKAPTTYDGVDYVMMSLRLLTTMKNKMEELASENQVTQSQQICQSIEEGIRLRYAIKAVRYKLEQNPPMFAMDYWMPSDDRCVEFIMESVAARIAGEEERDAYMEANPVIPPMKRKAVEE